MAASGRTLAAALLGLISAGTAGAEAGPIAIEAETGTLHGVEVAAVDPGFSGSGYVTGFDGEGDRLVLRVQAEAGVYDVVIRHRTMSGKKGVGLVVNGAAISGTFPGSDTFTDYRLGKVELAEGLNTIELTRGWGYFAIDALRFEPAGAIAGPAPVPATLSDPRATAEARRLMAFLTEGYGQRVVSGQQDLSEADFVAEATGRAPVIVGIDLMDYSPSRRAHGSDPGGEVEAALERAARGHLVTVSWHWNAPTDLLNGSYTTPEGNAIEAPWWRGFYTEATTFDVAAALAEPDGERYRLLVRDIDAIAGELRKFADAGVPVLWRPLHEAEGGWFWWGAKGPEAFTALWRLVYERLTEHHGLHNLVWVFTGGENASWFPGDAYVDVVGVDAYPESPDDPLTGTWEALQAAYGGRKLVALTEFGGVPDVDRMRRYGVWFAYFLPWTGDLGPRPAPAERLGRVYGGEAVVTFDEFQSGRVYGSE